MKITQDIREYAAENGLQDGDAIQKGMDEKSKEFAEKGVNVPVMFKLVVISNATMLPNEAAIIQQFLPKGWRCFICVNRKGMNNRCGN